MTFSTFGLNPSLVATIAELGYKQPTPIQAKAIPAILAGRDLLATAQTGTGKTAGFVLPILTKLANGQRASANQARALILTPTRELAIQVGEAVASYGGQLPLRYASVYGGVKINPQMMTMRKGVDVLVATPGRLLDLSSANAIRFQQLKFLVLDEADRMLDLGFASELSTILKLLPNQRQNLLFTATLSPQIRTLAQGIFRNPLEISVSPQRPAATNIKHWLCPVDKKKKPQLLRSLIKRHQWQQVLVFTKTRKGADSLSRFLAEAGLATATLHGDKTQGARNQALDDFKSGAAQILVATDVAARGLDIDQLPQVVNFDLPIVAEDYIHRIGRTGRAGHNGEAISLVCADEFPQLRAIEQLLKKLIPREYIDGFEPSHDLPASPQPNSTPKIKRPKKPKPGKPQAVGGAEKSGKTPAQKYSANSNRRQKPKTSAGKKPAKRR